MCGAHSRVHRLSFSCKVPSYRKKLSQGAAGPSSHRLLKVKPRLLPRQGRAGHPASFGAYPHRQKISCLEVKTQARKPVLRNLVPTIAVNRGPGALGWKI